MLAGVVLAWVVGVTVASHWYRPGLDHFFTIGIESGVRRPDIAASAVILVDVSAGGREKVTVVDRAVQARVFRKLAELGAWGIGVDMIYEEPRGPAEDRELGLAIRDAGRVILASRYDPTELREAASLFSGHARDRGIANLLIDPHDGYCRRIQHHYREPGINTPYSLSLALARYALSPPPGPPVPVEEHPDGLSLQRPGMTPLIVPVDEQGLSLLQYQGLAGTIPVIGWKELLGRTRAKLDLTGRVAIVGNVQLEIQDAWLTPFHRGASSKLSGVEIHAQDLMGLLSQDRRRVASRPCAWLAGGVAAVVGVCAGRVGSPLQVLLILIALVGVSWAGSLQLFLRGGLYLNPLVLILPASLGLAAGRTRGAAGQPRERDAGGPHVPEDRVIARAHELMSERRPTEALRDLQSIVAASAGQVSAPVRWALTRAFAALGQPALAAHYLDDLDLDAIGLEQLEEVGRLLESAGGLEQAIRVYGAMSSRSPTPGDLESRVQKLEAETRALPDWLRRELGSRYADVTLVGTGGMGRVYRGLDLQNDRLVAIKVPDEALLAAPGERKRFRREGALLAGLEHPNIVRLLEISTEGPAYYTMEYVAGKNLAELLRTRNRLECREVLDIMVQVASALSTVHRTGLVHRDIKPANILVDTQGVVKVADFGLAFASSMTRITGTGQYLGTLTYMAPEQLEVGDPAPVWDIYACGVILFEALSGAPPFPVDQFWRKIGDDPASLAQVRTGLPVPVVALVDSCLSRRSAGRPRDGEELHSRLHECMQRL